MGRSGDPADPCLIFMLFFTDIPHFFQKRDWTAFLSESRSHFEKAFLSDFRFAVQMSPKSNCIGTADRRMGGEGPCSSLSMREIKVDSRF